MTIKVPVMLTQDAFLEEVESLFLAPTNVGERLRFAKELRGQFIERLETHDTCMLPSYHYSLPKGHETGRFVAVDVGGSSLRIALVDLGSSIQATRPSTISKAVNTVKVFNKCSWDIDEPVRNLVGADFFQWLAAKIKTAIGSELETLTCSSNGTVPLAVAWSFPIR